MFLLSLYTAGILLAYSMNTVKIKMSESGIPHPVGDPGDLLVDGQTGADLHSGKIQGMKSISKPRLVIEIYTICQNLSPKEYRKKSFLKNIT